MKIKTKSFRLKLWMYFVFFTAMIFIVLWLLQTVFLQSFYNDMLIKNTQSAAGTIIENSSCETIDDTIDELTRDNSILVFITDESGNLIYSSDEFKGIHNQFGSENSGDETKDQEHKTQNKHMDGYRALPEIYSTFLDTLKESESGTAEYVTDHLYIYGTYIDYYNTEEKAVLYISTTLDAVGAPVHIISVQLIWVTVLSLLTGFVLSWFIARKFGKPLAQLSEKAKKLGKSDYSAEFGKSFCSEFDELNHTLDKTSERLIRSGNFQMELLANVSHDLRTPLTMIKGYAEMIRDISWEDEQQCREDLAVIIKEADRLTALVNEILEYSELQSEEHTEELTEVDLSHIVNRVTDSFEVLYKPERIVIERETAKEVVVLGNSSRLERALFNLMDNAVRHTGESRKIKVSLSVQNHKARIDVTDYGSGISPAELEHIWDRYYTSRQRKGKGVSGLGLAIVKQTVMLHNGNCYVKSSENKGSTFTIELDCKSTKS